MKNSLITLLTVIFLFNAQGQGQWEWANTPDSANISTSFVVGSAKDNFNNVISTGFYSGLSINNSVLPGGGSNYFIISTNSSGSNNWIKTGNSSNYISSHGVCTDKTGNIYVVGSFSGTLTIESTVLTHTTSNRGFFLAKYSSGGILRWAIKIGELPNSNIPGAIINHKGFIFITGAFKSTNGQILTIGSNTFITSQSPSNNDIYYTKLDTSGAIVSAQSFGGTQDDAGIGLAATQTDEILLIGSYRSSQLPLGNATLSGPSSTLSSIFIAKINISDNVVWTKKIDEVGGGGYICTDSNDNIFVAGSFSTPQISLDNLFLNRTPSERNIFLIKLDAIGNTQWLRGIGGNINTGFEGIGNVVVDSQDDIFVCGSYQSPLLTVGNFTLGNTTLNARALIVRYNQNGDVTNAMSCGSPSTTMYARSIVSDQDGNVYVGGHFEGDRVTFGSFTKWGAKIASFYLAKVGGLRTGIEENSGESRNIIMFPNPAVDAVRIKLETSQIKSVRLFNTEGKEIDFYKFTSNEIELPVSTLVEGEYFLEIVTSENHMLHKKLIKHH